MMNLEELQFTNSSVNYYFNASFSDLQQLIENRKSIFLTDENLAREYAHLLESHYKIIIPAGEEHKQLSTVEIIIKELIRLEADRNTLLIGFGGGVVTDIAGYVASIYMRGIACAYVPTSLLNLVDASIGGKTGVDVGKFKNMIGTIRQPEFILQDLSLLKTLPQEEWANGFAEIIKHACIFDSQHFTLLQERNLSYYQQNINELSDLINRNILLKYKVVAADEFEKGERKLLNFGHTIGHALENIYSLSHGQAVAIGMVLAAKISEKELGFRDTLAIERLLTQYQLPNSISFHKDAILPFLNMDKKRKGDAIQFIALSSFGDAKIIPLSLAKLEIYLSDLEKEIR